MVCLCHVFSFASFVCPSEGSLLQMTYCLQSVHIADNRIADHSLEDSRALTQRNKACLDNNHLGPISRSGLPLACPLLDKYLGTVPILRLDRFGKDFPPLRSPTDFSSCVSFSQHSPHRIFRSKASKNLLIFPESNKQKSRNFPVHTCLPGPNIR